MMEMGDPVINQAIADFHRARRQAQLEQLIARLTGKSVSLLSYDEVAQQLKLGGGSDRGLQEIPLSAIVGSVGRYNDFTRNFLPRQDNDARRWAEVQIAVTGLAGLPPIEVYQIGQAYFVLDGNHRVSVARRLGATYIQAHVTEIRTKIPLTPDIQPDELIIKARYAHFLEETRLDRLRPEADLSVTVPGAYRLLQQQIDQLQQQLSHEQGAEIPYAEAVTAWYDSIYVPVVELIREQGMLQDFPGRTETDLYTWISRHREEVEQALGWSVSPEIVAASLVTQHSPKPQHLMARVGGKILSMVTPKPLEAGPPAGQWRRQQVTPRRTDRLFNDILVALNGAAPGWLALEYALIAARREGGRVHGLHVTEQETSAEALPAEFERRLQQRSVSGELALEAGAAVTEIILNRARWTDLVVVSLSYPPAPQLLARLGSGFASLVRRCPRPLLAVPSCRPLDSAEAEQESLSRALLAYDGSPKAQEALFVATYLSAQWNMALVVLSAGESQEAAAAILPQAQAYLEAHRVQAAYLAQSGPVAETILRVAAEQHSNLIIMGGYGFSPIFEMVWQSSVDQVLRESCQPVLICR